MANPVITLPCEQAHNARQRALGSMRPRALSVGLSLRRTVHQFTIGPPPLPVAASSPLTWTMPVHGATSTLPSGLGFWSRMVIVADRGKVVCFALATPGVAT